MEIIENYATIFGNQKKIQKIVKTLKPLFLSCGSPPCPYSSILTLESQVN